MEDRCLMCIVSRASGNAGKGCLEQPKEPEACELSQGLCRRRAIPAESRYISAP